jgi:hypothetical protein
MQFYRPPGTKETDPAFAKGLITITQIEPDGLHSQLHALQGETAEFRSTVTILSEKDGTFLEQGSIRFGTAGSVQFSTIGTGYLRQSQDGNLTPGTVMWQIDSGDGVFAGVYGAITSNFLVSLQTNELIDNHVGVIYVK